MSDSGTSMADSSQGASSSGITAPMDLAGTELDTEGVTLAPSSGGGPGDTTWFEKLFMSGRSAMEIATVMYNMLSPEAKKNAKILGDGRKEITMKLAKQIVLAIKQFHETGTAQGMPTLLRFDGVVDDEKKERVQKAREFVKHYAPHKNAQGPCDFKNRKYCSAAE